VVPARLPDTLAPVLRRGDALSSTLPRRRAPRRHPAPLPQGRRTCPTGPTRPTGPNGPTDPTARRHRRPCLCRCQSGHRAAPERLRAFFGSPDLFSGQSLAELSLERRRAPSAHDRGTAVAVPPLRILPEVPKPPGGYGGGSAAGARKKLCSASAVPPAASGFLPSAADFPFLLFTRGSRCIWVEGARSGGRRGRGLGGAVGPV